MKISKYWQDLAERAARTFVQTYYAAWTVASLPALVPSYDKMFTVLNLQISAAATVASVAMSLVAKNIGNHNSASVLPEVRPPAPKPKPAVKAKKAVK